MPAKRLLKQPYPVPGQLLAVDTEGTGLRPHKGHRPFLYTVCNDAGAAVALWEDQPVNPKTGMFWPEADHTHGPARATMQRWMADPTITKVFHNAKYDLRMMSRFGIEVAGTVHDTMIMGHCLSAFGEVGQEGAADDVKVLQLLSLDTLAKKYLGDQKIDKVKEWIKTNRRQFVAAHGRDLNFSDVPRDIMEEYARHDPVLTMKLFYVMNEHLDRLKLRGLYETEMALLRVVVRMEERGVRLDLPFMRQRIQELTRLEADSLATLVSLTGPITKVLTKQRSRQGVKTKIHKLVRVPASEINFGSDRQIIKALAQFGLATEETTATGQMKMDERNLERLDHPFTKELVRWRQYSKVRHTYYEGYMERANGEVLHPNYIQIGTATGRFSSRDPNLQNIPTEQVVRERAGADVIYKGVKRCFIPRPGFINYHLDYSQIEMKMMAHFANDPKIDEAVQKRDIHTEITKLLYGDIKDPKEFEYKRVLAKIVSFGILYGMSRKTFMWKLKVDVAKVSEILEHYFRTFPGIKRFQSETIRQVQETGQVRNMFGRRYLINRDKGYVAVNYLCQGSAADLIKRVMVKLGDLFRAEALRSNILMMVHDELVFEVHESEDSWLPRKLVEVMQAAPECRVPIKVSVERADGNWEDLHKVCMKCGGSLDGSIHIDTKEKQCPQDSRWPVVSA